MAREIDNAGETDNAECYLLQQIGIKASRHRMSKEEYERRMKENRAWFSRLSSAEKAYVTRQARRLRREYGDGEATPPEEAQVERARRERNERGSSSPAQAPRGRSRPRGGPFTDPREMWGPGGAPKMGPGYNTENRRDRRIYEPGQGPLGAEHWQDQPGRPGVPRPRQSH